MATWDDVASIIGELQLTDERSPPEERVGKKLIAWERPLRKSDREALAALGIEPPEGDILGVRVADEGVKFALIADEPDVYFTTSHFDGYPAVLVKLAEIDELGEGDVKQRCVALRRDVELGGREALLVSRHRDAIADQQVVDECPVLLGQQLARLSGIGPGLLDSGAT